LEKIRRIAEESANRVGNIAQAAQQQLRLTQDVVVAVEQIDKAAKTARGRAEKAHWTTKTLTSLAKGFDTALRPLHSCLDGSPQPLLPNVSQPADATPSRQTRRLHETTQQQTADSREPVEVS
jgi:hypothetical protein